MCQALNSVLRKIILKKEMNNVIGFPAVHSVLYNMKFQFKAFSLDMEKPYSAPSNLNKI